MGFYTANGIPLPERHLCSEGEIVAGKYRIGKTLGTGAFGHVYKVTDMSGMEYALKVLHLWDVPSDIRQPLVERFEMEFRTGQIHSEYLVHSVDSGYLSGNPYIVMEFCTGGDLSAKLGSMPFEDIVRVAGEILKGLQALHSNGKVHRDLKPENVLIKKNGVSALTDFGIAGDRNKRMTERNIFGRPYQMFGTYAYMPPEQVSRARGGSTVLPTTDIFSFGVLLYQIITGVLPFGKLEDQNDLVMYQKKGKAGEWDKITLYRAPNGAMWEKLIAGCLQPDYKLRIQNAQVALMLLPNVPTVNKFAAPVSDRVPVQEVKLESIQENRTIRLKVLQGQQFNTEFDLEEIVLSTGRNLIKIGRDNTNNIQLKEYNTTYTSRRHCTLERHAQGVWVLRDGQWDMESGEWRNSSNGTYVNSTEVTPQGIRISPGDIITMGEITMRVEQN